MVLVVKVIQSVQLFAMPLTIWFEDVKWPVFLPLTLLYSYSERKKSLSIISTYHKKHCYGLVMSDSVTPWTVAGLLCPCDFPGKNTGVGCHLLLQGIFLPQRSILGLLQLARVFFTTEPIHTFIESISVDNFYVKSSLKIQLEKFSNNWVSLVLYWYNSSFIRGWACD